MSDSNTTGTHHQSHSTPVTSINGVSAESSIITTPKPVLSASDAHNNTQWTEIERNNRETASDSDGECAPSLPSSSSSSTTSLSSRVFDSQSIRIMQRDCGSTSAASVPSVSVSVTPPPASVSPLLFTDDDVVRAREEEYEKVRAKIFSEESVTMTTDTRSAELLARMEENKKSNRGGGVEVHELHLYSRRSALPTPQAQPSAPLSTPYTPYTYRVNNQQMQSAMNTPLASPVSYSLYPPLPGTSLPPPLSSTELTMQMQIARLKQQQIAAGNTIAAMTTVAAPVSLSSLSTDVFVARTTDQQRTQTTYSRYQQSQHPSKSLLTSAQVQAGFVDVSGQASISSSIPSPAQRHLQTSKMNAHAAAFSPNTVYKPSTYTAINPAQLQRVEAAESFQSTQPNGVIPSPQQRLYVSPPANYPLSTSPHSYQATAQTHTLAGTGGETAPTFSQHSINQIQPLSGIPSYTQYTHQTTTPRQSSQMSNLTQTSKASAAALPDNGLYEANSTATGNDPIAAAPSVFPPTTAGDIIDVSATPQNKHHSNRNNSNSVGPLSLQSLSLSPTPTPSLASFSSASDPIVHPASPVAGSLIQQQQQQQQQQQHTLFSSSSSSPFSPFSFQSSAFAVNTPPSQQESVAPSTPDVIVEPVCVSPSVASSLPSVGSESSVVFRSAPKAFISQRPQPVPAASEGASISAAAPSIAPSAPPSTTSSSTPVSFASMVKQSIGNRASSSMAVQSQPVAAQPNIIRIVPIHSDQQSQQRTERNNSSNQQSNSIITIRPSSWHSPVPDHSHTPPPRTAAPPPPSVSANTNNAAVSSSPQLSWSTRVLHNPP